MNVFNSQAGQHEDDSDITIINPSINENNENSLTNSQIQRPAATVPNFNFPSTSDPSDYIFVHHDPLENAKKIEDVLMNYIRDLKRESNTQLDCDKQLVIRLIDLIRPPYSTNQQKLDELDRIRDDIGVLHDKRFVQQKEELEKLRLEIDQLNRMLFTASNDHSIYEDQMKSYSIYKSLPAGASITGYNQWAEIETDAKKLHGIVQSQRNQIDEIVSLISQATSTKTSIEQSEPISTDQPTNINDKSKTIEPPAAGFDNKFLSDILKKLRIINRNPLPELSNSGDNNSNTTIISEHTPGASPTESMDTIVKKTMTASINEPEPVDETPVVIEEPIVPPVEPKPKEIEQPIIPPVEPKPKEIEQPIVPPVEPKPKEIEQPIIPPVEPKPKEIEQPIILPVPINPVPTPIPADALRQCPVCNYEFSPNCDDVKMYEHIDRCLFPADSFQTPKEYECPSCSRKYPADREDEYLHHMSDCFNTRFDE